MSVWDSRPALRWLVPAATAALVLGGGAAVGAITAAADPSLPPRSAAQLLVDLQSVEVDGFSGTIVQRADLGLPAVALPRGGGQGGPEDPGGQGSASLSSLLAGTHTLRVWYAGPERARVALLDTLGQSDIIRNGTDLWTWDSRANAATHRTLPEGLGRSDAPPLDPRALPVTPEQAAEAVLAAVDPTTVVSTDGTASVAGRDAYELVLAPRDGKSLIRQVRLAVDAVTHLPLRVQVYGAGDDPAYEVYFTRISLERPDEEQFRFNPPPGVTVSEDHLVPGSGPVRRLMGGGGGAGEPRITVVGEGWTSVLVARPQAGGTDPAPDATPDARGDGGPGEAGMAALVEGLPEVRGSWGSGRILSGKLFSVLITDDGRVLVGAVTADRLAEVAADPAAALEGE